MKKELKIGEQITISGREYLVEKAERCSCRGCVFYQPSGCGQSDLIVASCIVSDAIFKTEK